MSKNRVDIQNSTELVPNIITVSINVKPFDFPKRNNATCEMSESENASLGRNVRVTIMSPENVGAALMSRNHPRAIMRVEHRRHGPTPPQNTTSERRENGFQINCRFGV